MMELGLDRVESVLCLGAHADDIEIGCGGLLLRLAQNKPGVNVRWVVFSGRGRRGTEARRAARAFLKGFTRCRVSVEEFEDGYFPHDWRRIKRYFEGLKTVNEPDVVLTHYREDRHQDHRVVSDLTWNTFRRNLILEYEIPKYDGDLGSPNVFVRLEEEICRTKADLARRNYTSQGEKPWFTPDTFMGLMRLRGMECGSPTRYAEAFYCRKLVL
jgi:LmbE family N-acetylglucosaminyl deacetylase